jgi:hypothetical protein
MVASHSPSTTPLKPQAPHGGLPRSPARRQGIRALFGRLKKVIKRRRKLVAADVVIVSHAKSGRTWLATMISHVYHRRHGIAESELIQFDNFHRLDSRVPRILFSHDNRKDESRTPLFTPDGLRRQKVVLLVRDPCDVAVSAYFQSFRDARKGLGPGHAGRDVFDYVIGYKLPLVLKFLRRWHDQLGRLDQVLVVRYEDLRTQAARELARVMTFIDGAADPDDIEAAVAFASFEQMKQKEATNFFKSDKLRPGDSGDPQSFKVRKGRVGGFRDHFTEEQLAEIEDMVAAAGLTAFGYGPSRPAVEATP